jgi:hypothetical protein
LVRRHWHTAALCRLAKVAVLRGRRYLFHEHNTFGRRCHLTKQRYCAIGSATIADIARVSAYTSCTSMIWRCYGLWADGDGSRNTAACMCCPGHSLTFDVLQDMPLPKEVPGGQSEFRQALPPSFLFKVSLYSL